MPCRIIMYISGTINGDHVQYVMDHTGLLSIAILYGPTYELKSAFVMNRSCYETFFSLVMGAFLSRMRRIIRRFRPGHWEVCDEAIQNGESPELSIDVGMDRLLNLDLSVITKLIEYHPILMELFTTGINPWDCQCQISAQGFLLPCSSTETATTTTTTTI